MKPATTYRAVPEFYDAEYARLPMLARDVPFFLSWLETRAGDRTLDVLEVGVGTGRAALPVVAAGHRVLGFDVDRQLLDRAEHKRRAAGVDEDRLTLLEADAADLPDLGRTFDVAAVFFSTFLAFTTTTARLAVLQGVRRHLRQRGRLWIDVFNPDFELLAGAIGGARDLEPTLFVAEDGRHVMRLTHLRHDPVRQRQQVTFDYRWIDPAGRRGRLRRRFKLSWILPRELRLLLKTCGFRVTQMFGDYDGSPVKADSPRLIVVARRSPDVGIPTG